MPGEIITPLFPMERVQLFGDAFYSIIATVAVTKLAHLEADEVTDVRHCDGDYDCSLAAVLLGKLKSYLVFVVVFNLVALAWKAQSRAMFGVERAAGRVVTVQVMFLFLCIAWLPVTARVAAAWESVDTGPIAFFVNVALVLVLVIILEQCLPSKKQSTKGAIMTGLVAVGGSGVAILVCLVGVPQWALASFVITTLLLARVASLAGITVTLFGSSPRTEGEPAATDDAKPVAAVTDRSSSTAGRTAALVNLGKRLVVRKKTYSNKFDVGRLEAFTDGVHAIVATLIVLDIQPPFEAGSLDINDWVLDNLPNILASCISITLVSILWQQHHVYILLYPAEAITQGLYYLNNAICTTVPFLSMATSLVVELPSEPLSLIVASSVLLSAALWYWVALAYLSYQNRRLAKLKAAKQPQRQIGASGSGETTVVNPLDRTAPPSAARRPVPVGGGAADMRAHVELPEYKDGADEGKEEGRRSGEGVQEEVEEEEEEGFLTAGQRRQARRLFVDRLMAITIASVLGFPMAALAPTYPGITGVWSGVFIFSWVVATKMSAKVSCGKSCDRLRHGSEREVE